MSEETKYFQNLTYRGITHQRKAHSRTMYYVQTPQYEVVKHYVRNGLPKDHWSLDCDLSDSNPRKRNLPTWHDTASGEYSDYPDRVLYSARFMDGLTSTMYMQASEYRDAYVYAGCRSKKCTWWHEKFVQHAGVVYNYHYNKQMYGGSTSAKKQKTCGGCSSSSSSASDGSHPAFVDPLGNHALYKFDHNTYSGSPIQSGHLVGEYIDANNRANFLKFCISESEGHQSQTLMRNKLFCVLDFDAHKLPKSKSRKGKDKEIQQKWFHTLQSVIDTFYCLGDPWLTFKFYGEEDLHWLFEDLLPRIRQTLNQLHGDKFFETKEGSEGLILILLRMKGIEKEFDNIKNYCSRKSLFATSFKKYLPIADAGYRTSHENTAQLKKLTLETLVFQKRKEDEDE